VKPDSYKPLARQKGMLATEVRGELVVVDTERHRASALNPSLALLFRSCNGKRTVAELSAMFSKQRGLPEDESAVWLALRRLEKARLIEQKVPLPTNLHFRSRRRALQLMGLGAGALATILMPTPAQAASCEACGHTCTGNGRPCCFPCQCTATGSATGTCA
jgi:hypothetical protein